MFIEESVLHRFLTGGDLVKEYEIEVVLENILDEIVDIAIDQISTNILILMLTYTVNAKKQEWKYCLCTQITSKMNNSVMESVHCCSTSTGIYSLIHIYLYRDCVNILEEPESQWFCDSCKN